MTGDRQDVKMAIRYLLATKHRGSVNAIKSKDLAKMFETAPESVRDMTTELRKDGVPICSSVHGFYYASSKEDVQATINHLDSRATDLLASIDGLKKAMGTLK